VKEFRRIYLQCSTRHLPAKEKLYPPPDLLYPDITEWSKPLPPEQWAKRSPELEAAIAQREAELAAQAERELA
jgi:hypothetical protein